MERINGMIHPQPGKAWGFLKVVINRGGSKTTKKSVQSPIKPSILSQTIKSAVKNKLNNPGEALEKTMNNEEIFEKRLEQLLSLQPQGSSSQWLMRQLKSILCDHTTTHLNSEAIITSTNKVAKKIADQSTRHLILDVALAFCNQTRIKSDGGVICINHNKGCIMLFGQKALSCRMLTSTLKDIISASKQQDLGDAEMIRNIASSLYKRFQESQPTLTNNIICRICNSLLDRYQNTDQAVCQMIQDVLNIFVLSHEDKTVAFKENIPQIHKIPVFIPETKTSKEINKKIESLRKSISIVRGIPDKSLIEITFNQRKYWLLIQKKGNSKDVECSLFNTIPSEREMEELEKTGKIRSISRSMIISVLSNNILGGFFSFDENNYTKICNTVFPGALDNFILILHLTLISITQSAEIAKEAYELCGLDYRDYQYRREETKIDDRATPRKNDSLDDGRVIRYYPYQDRSKRNQEVRQGVQHLAEGERKSEASGKSPVAHKVLLPAKKKPDGTIQSYKPSPKYQEIAKELGFELGKGIQLFDTNEVIYPENIAEMLQILEKKTVEDAVNFLNEGIPKDQLIAAIRYETVAVPQQTSPETQEVVDIVYARVRHITDRNRFSETKGGSSR